MILSKRKLDLNSTGLVLYHMHCESSLISAQNELAGEIQACRVSFEGRATYVFRPPSYLLFNFAKLATNRSLFMLKTFDTLKKFNFFLFFFA